MYVFHDIAASIKYVTYQAIVHGGADDTGTSFSTPLVAGTIPALSKPSIAPQTVPN
jgi:hypothetical protein